MFVRTKDSSKGDQQRGRREVKLRGVRERRETTFIEEEREIKTSSDKEMREEAGGQKREM